MQAFGIEKKNIIYIHNSFEKKIVSAYMHIFSTYSDNVI